MSDFIPWSSQSFDEWSERYARGSFIDLEGRKTHYIEKGEGEPLILLHGFFYDSCLWSENIDVLAKNYKVYALDFWGGGYSTREPLDYGYQLYSEQLRLFMDSLGIASASLIGQSMGGGTAIAFCLQHRQRVNKLVLVDCAGLPNPLPLMGKFFNLPIVGEFFMRLKTDAIRKAGLTNAFIYNKELVTDEYFANVTRHQKIKRSTEIGLEIQRKRFFDTLSREIRELSKLHVPTLIVWGREDKGTPLKLGEEMHRILEGSRLEILDNAGHVSNFEQAEKFNGLVTAFLAE